MSQAVSQSSRKSTCKSTHQCVCVCIVCASCARVFCSGFCDIQDAPEDAKVKAQPVSGLEDQRAPRPVEPEVLANDGDVLAREAHDVPVHLAPKASALEFADIRADGPARKHAVGHSRTQDPGRGCAGLAAIQRAAAAEQANELDVGSSQVAVGTLGSETALPDVLPAVGGEAV